jgi:hypothetical protein
LSKPEFQMRGARLQTRCAVSKRAQGAEKENVLLEAIPASSADDHLVLKRAEVQLRRSTQKDIDALVGDRGRMSVDNRPERLKSRRTGATVASACKPTVLIEIILWQSSPRDAAAPCDSI